MLGLNRELDLLEVKIEDARRAKQQSQLAGTASMELPPPKIADSIPSSISRSSSVVLGRWTSPRASPTASYRSLEQDDSRAEAERHLQERVAKAEQAIQEACLKRAGAADYLGTPLHLPLASSIPTDAGSSRAPLPLASTVSDVGSSAGPGSVADPAGFFFDVTESDSVQFQSMRENSDLRMCISPPVRANVDISPLGGTTGRDDARTKQGSVNADLEHRTKAFRELVFDPGEESAGSNVTPRSKPEEVNSEFGRRVSRVREIISHIDVSPRLGSLPGDAEPTKPSTPRTRTDLKIEQRPPLRSDRSQQPRDSDQKDASHSWREPKVERDPKVEQLPLGADESYSWREEVRSLHLELSEARRMAAEARLEATAARAAELSESRRMAAEANLQADAAQAAEPAMMKQIRMLQERLSTSEEVAEKAQQLADAAHAAGPATQRASEREIESAVRVAVREEEALQTASEQKRALESRLAAEKLLTEENSAAARERERELRTRFQMQDDARRKELDEVTAVRNSARRLELEEVSSARISLHKLESQELAALREVACLRESISHRETAETVAIQSAAKHKEQEEMAQIQKVARQEEQAQVSEILESARSWEEQQREIYSLECSSRIRSFEQQSAIQDEARRREHDEHEQSARRLAAEKTRLLHELSVEHQTLLAREDEKYKAMLRRQEEEVSNLQAATQKEIAAARSSVRKSEMNASEHQEEVLNVRAAMSLLEEHLLSVESSCNRAVDEARLAEQGAISAEVAHRTATGAARERDMAEIVAVRNAANEAELEHRAAREAERRKEIEEVKDIERLKAELKMAEDSQARSQAALETNKLELWQLARELADTKLREEREVEELQIHSNASQMHLLEEMTELKVRFSVEKAKAAEIERQLDQATSALSKSESEAGTASLRAKNLEAQLAASAAERAGEAARAGTKAAEVEEALQSEIVSMAKTIAGIEDRHRESAQLLEAKAEAAKTAAVLSVTGKFEHMEEALQSEVIAMARTVAGLEERHGEDIKVLETKVETTKALAYLKEERHGLSIQMLATKLESFVKGKFEVNLSSMFSKWQLFTLQCKLRTERDAAEQLATQKASLAALNSKLTKDMEAMQVEAEFCDAAKNSVNASHIMQPGPDNSLPNMGAKRWPVTSPAALAAAAAAETSSLQREVVLREELKAAKVHASMESELALTQREEEAALRSRLRSAEDNVWQMRVGKQAVEKQLGQLQKELDSAKQMHTDATLATGQELQKLSAENLTTSFLEAAAEERAADLAEEIETLKAQRGKTDELLDERSLEIGELRRSFSVATERQAATLEEVAALRSDAEKKARRLTFAETGTPHKLTPASSSQEGRPRSNTVTGVGSDRSSWRKAWSGGATSDLRRSSEGIPTLLPSSQLRGREDE